MKSALFAAGLALFAACAQRPQLTNQENVLSQSVDADDAVDEDDVPVTITGVHHLGNQFTVDDFAVDGHWGGNVGRQGGGGSYVCCALLPRKWREGLKVEVRWKVSDWTYARQAEIDKSVYTSVKLVGNLGQRCQSNVMTRRKRYTCILLKAEEFAQCLRSIIPSAFAILSLGESSVLMGQRKALRSRISIRMSHLVGEGR